MPSKAPGADASLDEWLRWQDALHPQAIALGLERVRDVAVRLDLPRTGLPTLTVGGTNGKGSVTQLLAEIYRAAGYRVGMYTSPHLRRYNERVAIDGLALDDRQLVRGFAAVEQARGDTALTYFEYGTLAALWLFAHADLDVQVLEVGLGGRLDAVNLVDADVAVITSIGIDHVEYLGSTREVIGREKAGIFRPDRPAVCADPEPPASIAAAAKEHRAHLLQLGRDFDYRIAADAWNWTGPAGARYKKLPPPALAGAVQFRNAAAAVAAVTALQERRPVPETAIRAGLVRLRLPGRFERVPQPEGDIILDVAHNVEAARVLADNLRLLAPGAAHIVIGMLSDKPVEEFGAALAPQARRFYAAGLPGPRGLDGDTLAARLRREGLVAESFATVRHALAAARSVRRSGEPLLVCGSFLTVAEAAGVLHG